MSLESKWAETPSAMTEEQRLEQEMFEAKLGVKRNIKLTFDIPIKQTDPNTIEVELVVAGFEMFSEAFIKNCHTVMGVRRANRFLEEQAQRVMRVMVLEGVQ